MCNGRLRVRDTVVRFVRISSSEKYGITIRRLRCEVCGKIHRELPDFLMPHKHYPAECIESEIERMKQNKRVRSCDDRVCAYPELSTCMRWRQNFEKRQAAMKRALAVISIEEGRMLSKHEESLLQYYNLFMKRRKTGTGWLAECVRTAVNAGLSFCTEFAFPKDEILTKMKMPNVYTSDECHPLYENRRNGGYENMQKTETSIVKWLLLEICRVHFRDSTAFMATALGLSQKTLQNALSGTGGQRIVEVFEETMRYCVRNQLSLDAILMRYPSVQEQN